MSPVDIADVPRLDPLCSEELKAAHRSVDIWSSWELKKMHDFLKKRRNTVEYAPDRDKDCPKSKRRVRIAILDTGIDMEHPEIKARKSRIQDTFCQIKGLENKADEDTSGHGTCCTLLLMQIAPEADIYVARVFQDTKSV